MTADAGTTATTVIGDDVYVLCSLPTTNSNNIFKINLKTNKTDKIVGSGVNWFNIIEDKLYYVKNEDNNAASTATYFTQPRRKRTDSSCTGSLRTGKT